MKNLPPFRSIPPSRSNLSRVSRTSSIPSPCASTPRAGCSSARCAAIRMAVSAPATRRAARSNASATGTATASSRPLSPSPRAALPDGRHAVQEWRDRRCCAGHPLPRGHRRRRQGRQDDGPLHGLQPRQHPADGEQPPVGTRQLDLRLRRQRRRHCHVRRRNPMPRRCRCAAAGSDSSRTCPAASSRRAAAGSTASLPTTIGAGSRPPTASTCGKSFCPTTT